jgi:hypothetical protein
MRGTLVTPELISKPIETNRRWKNNGMSFELNIVRLVGSGYVRTSFHIGYLICMPEIPRRNKLSSSKSSTICTESLCPMLIIIIISSY